CWTMKSWPMPFPICHRRNVRKSSCITFCVRPKRRSASIMVCLIVPLGGICIVPCGSSMRKCRCIPVSRLLPYETIVKAHEGDPDAVNAVLQHYAGYIRYLSKVNGRVNADVEDYVIQTLIDSLFKFRLELPDNPKTE